MKLTTYSTTSKKKIQVVAILMAVVVLGCAWHVGGQIVYAHAAEETELQCWVLCRPGDYVNLRMAPSKTSAQVGFLECGDTFHTDGKTKDGFVHVLDAGDSDCWIWAGNVVMEEPKPVYQVYVCVAKTRVACRRWVDGPMIQGYGWLRNGSSVDVYYIADGWAVTSRGYIQAEWLEVNP